MTDIVERRRHRLATRQAMVRAVRYCKRCGRGQLPSRIDIGDGIRVWVCRYCKHTHTQAAVVSGVRE